MTRCQLAKPYSLASKFTHRRGVHIGRQSLMMLCYTRVTVLGASNTRKFYCLEKGAPAMARVARALPPVMPMEDVITDIHSHSVSQVQAPLGKLKCESHLAGVGVGCTGPELVRTVPGRWARIGADRNGPEWVQTAPG